MEYTKHAVNPYHVGCYSCVYSGVWRYLQESMNDNPLSFYSLNKLHMVVYGGSCKIAMNKNKFIHIEFLFCVCIHSEKPVVW